MNRNKRNIIMVVIGCLIPWILAIFTKYLTKWGSDIENVIFVFFIGILLQCVIGIGGLIRTRSDKSQGRNLFWINICPVVLLILLWVISGGYA